MLIFLFNVVCSGPHKHFVVRGDKILSFMVREIKKFGNHSHRLMVETYSEIKIKSAKFIGGWLWNIFADVLGKTMGTFRTC